MVLTGDCESLCKHFGMATAVLQNALVWMLWLVALASCGGAKGSPRPSIERVLYYGHLTIGTKKLNLLAEVNPTANKTELFRESFGENFDYQSDPDPNVCKYGSLGHHISMKTNFVLRWNAQEMSALGLI